MTEGGPLWVEKDGVKVSEDAYFCHDRIGVRLADVTGDVFVFALSQEATDRLIAELQRTRSRRVVAA
jgi:hypothetical protein